MPPTLGLRGLMSRLWVLIIIFVAVQSMVVSDLPLLITDLPLVLSGKAVVMQEQYLGPNSQCDFWAAVVTSCDLELRGRMPDGLWQSRRVSYTHLLGRPASLDELRVVGLPAEPYWLTVGAALDRVANRLLTAGFLLSSMVVLTVQVVRGVIDAWRIPRRIRSALSSKVLVPVLLRAAAMESAGRVAHRKRGFQLRRTDTNTAIVWTNPRGKDLFPLAGHQGDRPTMVLGVMAADGESVMPLDRALQWIDLTDTERQRLFRAALLQEGGESRGS